MTITSNTVYFHSFQVSLSPSTRGVSHVISTLFCHPTPLAAQAHNCLSGSLLSPTHRNGIQYSEPTPPAQLSPLFLHFGVSSAERVPFCIWPRVEFYGASLLPAFYFRSRGHRVYTASRLHVRSTVCPANIDLTSGMTVAFTIRIPILFHKKWTSHLHSLTLQVRCTVLQQ